MAFEGFLSLGGTEIANASRTKAYADELVPMLGLSDCWDCADLAEVLGDDPYTTPIIDRPDWFTDHDPDSWDFCGFYPLEIEGIDDGVREATVTELSLDGAVVGAPRYRSREIRVSGLLIGVTPAAVTYGLTWLAKALEGAPCRDAEGCTGDHLCYYSACPPMCLDSPALDVWPGDPGPKHHESQFYLCDGGLIESAARACSVDYERTLYQVSLTSGPSIVERYNSHCGSMLRVEFTLVAGVPFAFSTAVSAVPGLEPVPNPQVTPEVTCEAGSDVIVRTNLATNPVPIGNAAAAGKGWLADGTQYTAAVDTTVYRLAGGSSVRVQRNAVTASPNLAPNPQPTGNLTGWSWRLGQSNPGSPNRTNLVENPWPRLADGWAFDTAAMDVVTDAPGPDTQDGFVRHTQDVADDQPWTVTYTGTQVLAAGTTHTVSLYFRSTSARQVQFGGRTLDVPGYGWVRLTAQVTGDGTPLTITVSGTGQTAGEVIDVARALVEAAATLGPYFDGSTPDTGANTYAWTGTADASTSTATMEPAAATTTLATGTGPGSQTTFQRTTIGAPKAGGEDGPVYTMAAGEGLYTVTMQVRPSVAAHATLRVTALGEGGVVLTTVSSDQAALTANTWQPMPPVRISAPAGTLTLQVAALLPADVALPAGATFDAGAVQVVDGLFLTDPTVARATYLGQHVNTKSVIAVSGGGTYTASVYAGANVGSLATTSIAFYTSGGLPAGTVVRGVSEQLDAWTTPIGIAEWHRPYVTATAPSNAAYAVVSIEVRKVSSGAVLGDAAWFTSLLFEQAGSVLSYFDGSLPDFGNISYEWSGTANASTSFTLLEIPAEPGPIVDPDCPPIPAPPRPPLIDIGCVDTPTSWRRYVVDVGADLVPDWRDTVPIIRLQTHDTDVRQVRVRFYPNPLEAPLQALNPCEFCGEFVITYIPAHSVMTIDGIRQWVTVTDDQTGNVRTANQLLSSSDGGPVSWPVLSCGVAYTLVVDVSPTGVSDLTPQICLAARS